MGYVVSQYPATNHTFILREIRTLRRLGVDVCVVSIRKPDRAPSALSPEEAEELSLTYSVLGAGMGNALLVHLRMLATSPLAYIGALFYALGLAGSHFRKAGQYLLYFGEAVVAGDFLVRKGIRHTHTHFSSTVTLMLAKLFPISFSATIHGPDEFNDVVGFHMAEKVAAANFISTISHYAASQIMKASDPQYWNKVQVLPLGVDPNAFLPRPQPSGRAAFECVCVGRLAPAKAHLILFAAIGRLVAQGRTNIRLTVVGGGPAQASLEAAIAAGNLEPYIRMVGPCNQDRVLEFYRHANVFTLASFAEGVPVVLMEAMAMEIPCVTTWITGVPELIRADVDGLLIAPADAEALAAAIARLMDDPELCVRLGRSGRIRVLECYNLERNTERLEQVFRRYLLPGHPAPAAQGVVNA